MSTEAHWDRVYRTKRPSDVSWFRPHLEISLELIRRAAGDLSAPIIDVGGGASTLIDDLLDAGYRDLTMLDVSAAALESARTRLGDRASRVKWIVGDVTRIDLPRGHFGVWHDRAVFHFLTEPDDRRRYVETVLHSVAPKGHVIVATFGPQGPQRCSGLPTARYDAASLHAEFGAPFELVDRREELHLTPGGAHQQFIYCL